MKPSMLVAAASAATITLSMLPATTANAYVDGGSTSDHSCLTTLKTTKSGSNLVFALTSKCEYMGGRYGAINVGVTVEVKGKRAVIGSKLVGGGPSSVTTKVTVPNPAGTQTFNLMIETIGYGAYNNVDAGGVKDYYLLFLHTSA